MNQLLQLLPPDDLPPEVKQLDELESFAKLNARNYSELPPLKEHLLKDGIVTESSPWFPVFKAYLASNPLSWVKPAFNPREALITLNHRFSEINACQCRACQVMRYKLCQELTTLSCENR